MWLGKHYWRSSVSAFLHNVSYHAKHGAYSSQICHVPHLFLSESLGTHLSREPGVKVGLSPTLKLEIFLFFFSKYFLASASSFALYSFSMAARSR